MKTKFLSLTAPRNLLFALLLLMGLAAATALIPDSGAVVLAAELGDSGDPERECERDGDQERCKLVGLIGLVPVGDDLTGKWTVGDVLFRVTDQTELRPEDGEFTVGSCVGLLYDAKTEPYDALLIGLLPSDHCRVRDVDDQLGKPDEADGVIDAMPDRKDLVGIWTIDDVQYDVTDKTRLSDHLNVYAVGVCVEVHYDAATTPYMAYKIEPDADCDGDGKGNDDGKGDDDGANLDKETELRGRIEVLPDHEELLGIWRVNGTEFDVKATTEKKAEYGPFEVGDCVEIEYDDSTTPYTAIEIEGKRDYACRGPFGGDDGGDENDDRDDDRDGEGELFGVLQAFPPDLIGEWKVGNWIFLADGGTEFEEGRVDFRVGDLVKVEFYVTVDSETGETVNRATEIKLKYAHDGKGDDDDHGSHRGAEGNAFGPIDTFPAGRSGDWKIGGMPYSTNANTRFEQEYGEFGVGKWVKVRYHVDANDNRIADKIETKNPNASAQDPRSPKLVGFVKGMPELGFKGRWAVGGEMFTADSRTRFGEEHGELALGAYVELEYRLVNGAKVLHELHTEVPPNAGESDDAGAIEAMDDGVAAASLSAASTWRIAGRDYTVTDATLLDDSETTLAVGATALVNSYTAADGSQVATSVTGIRLDHQIYLPLAMAP